MTRPNRDLEQAGHTLSTVLAPMTPVEFAPKGERWPWYPLFTMTCAIGDRIDTGDPMSVVLNVHGDVKRGRVGIRRSVRSWFHMTPTPQENA